MKALNIIMEHLNECMDGCSVKAERMVLWDKMIAVLLDKGEGDIHHYCKLMREVEI